MSYQLELLKKYLLDKNVRMVIIKGLRRTGKTSLLNVVLSEIKTESIKIDVREAPFYDRKEFTIFLIKKIRGYEKFSFELFFSKEEHINLFFSSLNKQLSKKKQELILAFDEAQLLKRINFDYFLASIMEELIWK
jgi:AAA+ ATPase superfamily predicted ATPase